MTLEDYLNGFVGVCDWFTDHFIEPENEVKMVNCVPLNLLLNFSYCVLGRLQFR